MPKFLEDRLKREAAAKGLSGRRADAYVYGTMNNRGLMRGNQETAKGRAADAKHARDVESHGAMMGHPHRNLGKYLHPKKSQS